MIVKAVFLLKIGLKIVLGVFFVEIRILKTRIGADVPIRIFSNQRERGSLAGRKSMLFDADREIGFLVDVQTCDVIGKLLARNGMRGLDHFAFHVSESGVFVEQFGIGVIVDFDLAVFGLVFPLRNQRLEHVMHPDFCDRVSAFR